DIIFLNRKSAKLLLGTNNGTDMTIDADGEVGIGTTTPDNRLDLYENKSGSGFIAHFRNGNTSTTASGGDVLVMELGTTGSLTTNNVFLQLRDGNSVVGSISGNGTNTVQYLTTSDRRLKENVVTTRFSLADLLDLNVVDYNMIGAVSSELKTGFIAQELHKVYPDAVAVGGENKEESPWMVSYGSLTPLLVKSIQELTKIIADQQLQIDELLARKELLERE
ncbi:MAG: tail fiber domain-containing protein, partial [Flavobacteriales bacterium]|nr:tail fiber domain-containing protein [Flavobacteriales bacterium]